VIYVCNGPVKYPFLAVLRGFHVTVMCIEPDRVDQFNKSKVHHAAWMSVNRMFIESVGQYTMESLTDGQCNVRPNC